MHQYTPEQLAVLSPAGFAWYASQGKWVCPPHLQHLNNKLLDVAAGRCKRLIVTMPPRHGKSEFISKYFPAWYLGINPDARVILTSYESSFAASWGRKARDLMVDNQKLFGIQIAQDSASVQDWNIEKRMGGMNTAGVGGPCTGKGASVFIIDDPIKNNEEAMSEVIRDKAWDWYKSTAYTRLEPDGVMVVIMCMVGDTPVLMADGVEKPLRDIKIGDKVASYIDGHLTISKVVNWKNQGRDYVYKIKTISGIIVKANKRHPFLVERAGNLKWIKLQDLMVGDKMARASGANGAASVAPMKDAISPLNVEDIVFPTTAKLNGQADTGPNLVTQNQEGIFASGIDIKLAYQNTNQCSHLKMGNAPYVGNSPQKMCDHIGEENCALTMTTKQGKLGAYCATIATSQSGMEKHQKSYPRPLNTYEITFDKIESITSDGAEDVFDIQVEGTENFVANGLISHNTRWHDDDLVGRLLAEQKKGGEKWDIVDFPAIATYDDILGRKPGDALWPTRYDEKRLKEIEQTLGPFWWASMYQQNPVPAGGAIIKREWWKYYSERPDKKAFKRYIWAWDTAVKVGQENDFSVGIYIGETETGYYVLDIFREKVEYPDLKRAIAQKFHGSRASAIIIEDKSSGQQIIQEFSRGEKLPIIPAGKDKKGLMPDKVTRALVVTPMIQSGLVYLPENASWVADFISECLSFPKGKHDDQVDALVYALDYLKNQSHHGLDSFMFGGERESSRF